MGKLIRFLVVVAVLAFVAGEWWGFNLGVAGQTPVVAYKADGVSQAVRRTINRDSLPVNISGQVRHGSVTVQVLFERPASFQTGAAGLPQETVFQRVYNTGERIALNELVEAGTGIYTVVLDFNEGSGLFNVSLPTAAEL